MRHALDTVRLETDSQARSHVQLENSIRKEVEGPLIDFMRRVDSLRRDAQTSVTKLHKHKHQHYLVQRLRLRLPASSQMILWVYMVDPITASVALRIARLGRDPHVVACCRPCAYGRRTRSLRRVQGPASPLRQNICSGARRQSAAYCAVSLLT